jgi:glyoxylase-like metal-dependent hydrolase (beta-lactamase superfamily II)
MIMNLKKILLWIFLVVAVIAAAGFILFSIYVKPFMSKMMVVHTVQYDPQLTLVLGGGGNSCILTSDSVVLVVDSKMKDAAKNLYDQVKQIAGNKPIILVNTHVHTDHTGGNSFYKGQTIIAGGNYDKDFWAKDAGAETMPTVWVKDSLVFKVSDETVTVLNLGFDAHTQSDVVVYLSNRKMLFAGDVVLNKAIPALFKKYDASSAGYLKAFDLMEKRFDIKTVVPGHGDIGGPEVIDNFRNYFRDMQTAAQDDSKKGELTAKYKDWNQIPIVMSPGATIRYMKGENGK